MEITAVDLFCGAGGLTCGLAEAGIKVAAGYDVDEACRFPYEANNGSNFICKNVAEVTPEEILSHYPSNGYKLLAGCAPCQPFSKYTQNKNIDKSIGDNRWGLLYQFARLIRGVSPDFVTMENVPDVQKHQVYSDFKLELKKTWLSCS
ncbi:DNA cytosine methyltransferase [Vibrio parahaemolyticus]|nr:DNA cytosine methyltransferase [Vibrio parahaemolyticus]MDG3414254.1 DNA cytosine methyltransferase [Vibrio parahaemolyticus]